MSTWHRQRGGRYAFLYPRVEVTDSRGNKVWQPDMTATPKKVPYSGQYDRSQTAEVPGQQVLEYRNIQVPWTLPEPNVWGAVILSDEPGRVWDIDAPPAQRWGTRHVRHYTINLRLRP